jgi:hypothetical protein
MTPATFIDNARAFAPCLAGSVGAAHIEQRAQLSVAAEP